MSAVVACLVGLAVSAGLPDSSDRVDYSRDVRPILQKHCISCHGPKQAKAGLRLDLARLALKGSKSGPVIVPKQVDESSLFEAITSDDESTRMPKNRPPLADRDIDILRKWIEQGAVAPTREEAAAHWAFVAPRRPDLPEVHSPAWCRNPIDRFVLARLEQEKIKPSPEADRTTLIRRLGLDLLGLPPTPEEVQAFLLDNRPDAYEQLVDRLLASPHYGERMARHWLDLARYADSNGFNIDAPRTIWKYRDWVIDAFNRDLPFDAFTTQQLAGDLLPEATTDQIIATGFHRNTLINQEGGIDLEQFRVESVVDRVSTTGTVWLGLTIGCAQCHDHKFDPVSQREFYRLFAFFNNCDEPDLELGTPEQLAQHAAIKAQLKSLQSELNSYIKALKKRQPEWEKSLTTDARAKLTPEIQHILTIPADERNPTQQESLFLAFQQQDLGWKTRQETVQAVEKRLAPVVSTMVVSERSQPRETYIHIQGDFTRKGDVVEPGVPAVLNPLSASQQPNRLDLARWLVDPSNPLTSRVAVNRLWQITFGKGLVETENDFGAQGAPPSHPELLDWLATELVRQGWSQKQILRLIVTSATYRQASQLRPELVAIDRDNRLLARQSRLRLEAEIIRDSALASSGLLSEKIGGPSVFPPQPAGVMTLGQLKRDWTTSTGPDRYRRGMYTFFWRATPHPALMVFDAPDSTRTCTRRNRSNTPLQALTLLNDQAFFEPAQALALRVIKESPGNDTARIDRAFRLCLARPPRPEEAHRLASLLDQEREAFAKAPAELLRVVPKSELPKAVLATLAAWTTAARVLLNLDEFMTRE